MRKIDIRARVHHLDQMLQRRRSTLAQQADERRQLVSACQAAGDHVPDVIWNGLEAIECCCFCGLQLSAGQQQIARNLVTSR